MDAEFWRRAWQEGRTQFHRSEYHDALVRYLPELAPGPGGRVLVPLCGKSRDMLYLLGQGLEVHGVELYEPAVREFYTEHRLPPPRITPDGAHVHYDGDGVRITCGDLLRLDLSGAYDLVYDRGALVALPPHMRAEYVRLIRRALKPDGRCLLIAYEYDPSQMQGPPFDVREEEVQRLYAGDCSVRLLERERPASEGGRLSAVPSLRQTVYRIDRLAASLIHMRLRLSAAPGAIAGAVEEAARARIAQSLESLGAGETVRHSAILAAVLAVPGVSSAELIAPPDDVRIAAGERAMLGELQITHT